MHSPLSNNAILSRIQLSENLLAFQCPETSGIFLPISSYTLWLSKQPASELPSPDEVSIEHDSSTDSKNVLICPESGAIMQRYRVTANTPFYIDRSPSGSIWLDKGEWESLKSVGLTKCLNRIFTAPWQDAIRQKESEDNRTQLYQDKLGEDLYQQIISLANENKDHPHQAMIISLFNEVMTSKNS